MKTIIFAITLVALAGMAIGQSSPAQSSPAKKPATKPAASGPTKVTGEPTKTASGLEYWDIKVGTGAAAQTGQHVKVDYTGWLLSLIHI